MDILLQIGHKNIESITDERLAVGDAARLRRSTGAPGEREWAEALSHQLGLRLGELGCRVTVVDAIWHPDIYAIKYDLMLSLHHDGGGTDSHAMASEAFRNTNEIAAGWGYAMVRFWGEEYEDITGIPVKQQLVNANMTHYYGWSYPTVDTPRVLLEHGNGSSPHDWDVMHNHIAWIAQADALAVKKLFELSAPETVRLFPETGFHLGGGFKRFWEQFGDDNKSIRLFGYPLSEEMLENGLTVQYFERTKLEYHPGLPSPWDIQGSDLGRQALARRG